jgi:hypothetical protein
VPCSRSGGGLFERLSRTFIPPAGPSRKANARRSLFMRRFAGPERPAIPDDVAHEFPCAESIAR